MSLTKTERAALRTLRRRIALEPFRGGFSFEQLQTMLHKPNRGGLQDDSTEIRAALRLYLDSWVLPVIDALIKERRDELDTQIIKDSVKP